MILKGKHVPTICGRDTKREKGLLDKEKSR